MSEGVVTKLGALSMQVCVPKDWTDVQVIDFANNNNPAGTSGGWFIRKEGDVLLAGMNERVVCAKDTERVHIMLDC